MGLFKKLSEAIMISTADQESAVSLYKLIRAMNTKDASVSELTSDGETFQFSIKCKDAETMQSTVVLPAVYAHDNPNDFQLIVQYEDKSGKAKTYGEEIMTSFSFDSGAPHGDKRELEFIAQMKKRVSTEAQAAVDYVITDGAAATVAIPSAEPEKVKAILTELFESQPVTKFEIRLVLREPV